MSDGDVIVEHGGVTWWWVGWQEHWRWERPWSNNRGYQTIAMVWLEHGAWRYVTGAPGISERTFGTNLEAMDAAIAEVVAHRIEAE